MSLFDGNWELEEAALERAEERAKAEREGRELPKRPPDAPGYFRGRILYPPVRKPLP